MRARVPGFLVALGPDGPVGYATDVTIEETNDPRPTGRAKSSSAAQSNPSLSRCRSTSSRRPRRACAPVASAAAWISCNSEPSTESQVELAGERLPSPLTAAPKRFGDVKVAMPGRAMHRRRYEIVPRRGRRSFVSQVLSNRGLVVRDLEELDEHVHEKRAIRYRRPTRSVHRRTFQCRNARLRTPPGDSGTADRFQRWPDDRLTRERAAPPRRSHRTASVPTAASGSTPSCFRRPKRGTTASAIAGSADQTAARRSAALVRLHPQKAPAREGRDTDTVPRVS